MPVDAFRQDDRILTPDIAQHDREFLAAEPPEQVRRADRLARTLGENLKHAVANGMTEPVIDRLEVVEVHQQHRRRVGGRRVAAREFGVVEERSAVGDAGQRVDHRRGPMQEFGALFRHRQQDEGNRYGEHQRFEAQRRQPYALERLIGGRPRQHGAKRRPQQEQRAVREQQKDRRPTRHQRLGAAAPELVGGQPRVRGDDAGRDQEAKFEMLR